MPTGFQTSLGGNGPVGMTSFSNVAAAASGSFPVVLNEPSNQVTISNYGTTPLFINFFGPATAANYGIPGGQTFTYMGPPVTQFQLTGGGQNVPYGVFAV